VHVRRLQLTAYRNYRNIDLDLPPGSLLFTGDNAQGKSNLLEAVQLLASGRSVRATADAELIAWGAESEGQPFARLQAAVERRGGDVQLETLIVGATTSATAPVQRAGKRFRVNGIPRRAIDFVGQLRSVLFTADDLTIVSGSPSDRRLYLDVAISQLDRAYYGALQRYGRVLQQRNAALRRIKDGLAGPDELPFWDESLVREGAVILSARRRAVGRLDALAAAAHRELSGAAQEDLTITYEPALGDEWRPLLTADATVSSAQSLFSAALAAQRRRDLAAGLSLVGPHRDDLAITLNGASASSFGSRAQIRTAALSLRLAEARLLLEASTDPPVLLLDDIVSELDEARRRSVLEGVAGFDQVWFTATSAALLPTEFVKSCQSYEVRAGAIIAATRS
jgi:DNA replication and repair protein RecF